MPAREVSQEPGLWLATTPATSLLRRLTLAAMIVMLLIFAAVMPFAREPLPENDGFIPFSGATMFVTELVTAVLLYTQFSFVRSRAILVLANGYLFTSLIIVPYVLAFPHTFAPSGLIGAGLQTSGWLYIIWHFGFPTSVIVYAWMKNRAGDTTMESSVKAVICRNIVIVVGLVTALTLVVIAADPVLPQLMFDRTKLAPLAIAVSGTGTLVCLVAFLLLCRRQSSVLDRWLMIAIFAATLESAVVMVIPARFTVGWYVVRLFWVTASTAVLVGLLTETTVLYARLANAIVLLRRERANRLMNLDAAMSALAHELKQPLAAVGMSGAAALNWLNREPPEMKEVRASVASMVNAAHRADHVMSGVREIFKKRGDHRAPLHVNDVVAQVLSLMRHDLQTNGISVTTVLADDVPEVHADPMQLQQVILNLVRNAIDAMISTSPKNRRLRLATSLNGHSSVLLSVQDSGPGIVERDPTHIFEPFVTTKSSGMGLGLSICRTIAEDHGGELRLAQTDSSGCVFELMLPTGTANSTDGRGPP
jgi:signal transduction histidine kinase